MRNKLYRFNGGDLCYTVALSETGAYVTSITDTKAKKNYFSGIKELFRLTANDLRNNSEVSVSSNEAWDSQIAEYTSSGGIIALSGNEIVHDVTVVITVTCSDEFLTFDTEIINKSKRFSVSKCYHPELYFGISGEINFFYPYGPGEYQPSTVKGGWNMELSYPSYGASMQYMCFWDKRNGRGVYYGCHDIYPAHKKLCLERKAPDRNFRIGAYQLLSDINKPSNSQKLSGSVKLCAYDGDWYEAARIYKDFIENEALYTSDYGIDGRNNTPEWFRNTDVWLNCRVTEEKVGFADDIIKQAKILGVNPAIHLYYWHQIPFDNDYPHYFPMKNCVLGELKKLHEAGIKVMPYINGRLWDTRDKEDTDFEFTSVAKPWCTKDINGKPITETYASVEKDGSKVELAVMCPSTTLWQDTVSGIVKKLFDYGFDGVYIDQIAAAEGKPCCDKNHKHPAGGGEWWCRAYNTMLERISCTKPSDRMLTTECNADPFLKHLDGYLSWLWIKNNQVPAFPAVFSDKVITFGTDFRGLGNLDYGINGRLDEAGVRIFSAQSFLFGQQMGWMTNELFNKMPHRDFFVKLVRLREKFRRYFLGGTLLKPPVITDNGKKIVLRKCREAYNGYVESNSVNGMLWEENRTHDKVLFLINSAKEELEANVQSILPDGKYVLHGDVAETVKIKNNTFSVKIPPLSFCYIEVL